MAISFGIVTVALLCARDERTTLGRNISYIEELTGLDVWVTSPSRMRKTLVKLETVSPPPEDTWRLKYLEKLMEQRQELHVMGMVEEEGELQGLINSLCTS